MPSTYSVKQTRGDRRALRIGTGADVAAAVAAAVAVDLRWSVDMPLVGGPSR
jgi:hypothetical protein